MEGKLGRRRMEGKMNKRENKKISFMLRIRMRTTKNSLNKYKKKRMIKRSILKGNSSKKNI